MNEATRELFPITRHAISLNPAGVAPLPRPAVEALKRFLEEVTHRGLVGWDDRMAEVERTRAKGARRAGGSSPRDRLHAQHIRRHLGDRHPSAGFLSLQYARGDRGSSHALSNPRNDG